MSGLQQPFLMADHTLRIPGLGRSIAINQTMSLMATVVTIGLDLAKSVFQIHGVDDAARTALRRCA